ncbi:hypothetical protein HZC09_01855 [Candidatus Micrarchaeota archaeon]|nr:hypothetical protein [Candidatus Micrarchaeota archaeon]
MKLNLPRIVSIKNGTQTTLTGKQNSYLSIAALEAQSMVTDHEVMLLLLWALISPAAGLAYLVWKKYDRLRLLAIPLFLAAAVQFTGQWGGMLWVLQRFFNMQIG